MTDWPLHPSFPLFIWSAVENWVRMEPPLERLLRMNEKLFFQGDTEKLEIFTIDDEYVTTILEASNFIAPQTPGIYKARDERVKNYLPFNSKG